MFLWIFTLSCYVLAWIHSIPAFPPGPKPGRMWLGRNQSSLAPSGPKDATGSHPRKNVSASYSVPTSYFSPSPKTYIQQQRERARREAFAMACSRFMVPPALNPAENAGIHHRASSYPVGMGPVPEAGRLPAPGAFSCCLRADVIHAGEDVPGIDGWLVHRTAVPIVYTVSSARIGSPLTSGRIADLGTIQRDAPRGSVW